MSSPAENILKNFNLFIEGVGYAGNIDEIQLPNLKVKEEEHRAGGMDAPAPIDMGMEKMEASFTLTKYDPLALALFGTTVKNISVTARGAVQSLDGSVKAVVVKMTGKVFGYEPSAWKTGEKNNHKLTMPLIYYHHSIDGVPLHIIDVPGMVRIIGGVDQLAEIRSAIGVEGSAASVARNIPGI